MTRLWLRFRRWWHCNVYHINEVTPVDSERFLMNCTCGGCVQLHAPEHGHVVIEIATCAGWVYASRLNAMALPGARTRR